MASCYHPLRALDFGENPETGKHMIKITKGKYDPDEKPKFDGYDIIPIPCGRCVGCRLQYSRVWANRCMAEASMFDSNIFLTLTYNDDCLPPCYEGSMIHPLVKRDLQLFIKRLRRKLPDQKIRYFACGEYTPKLRPHYHLIIFNCKLDDLKLLYRNDSEFKYYTSKTISDCWYPEEDSKLPENERRSMGFHIVANCNWHTCAYTARYILKKQKGEDSEIYEKYNYPPEFTLMSRKPGIGREYFEQHAVDIYYDGAFLSTENGAMRIYPNKYYDSLFDLEYKDAAVVLDDAKKEAIEANNKLRSNLTSLSYQEMLESEERYKLDQLKSLKRKEM